MEHVMTTVVLLMLFASCVIALEPISTGAVVFAGIAAYSWASCKYLKECCDSHSIGFRSDELEKSFREHVFGQHIATDVIPSALKGHYENPNPKKALVFSFHGWTGSGKNWMANFIADSVFVKKRQSRFYHLFVGTKHFPHADRVEEYKKIIQQEVMQSVANCPYSLFVFDEVEKMAPGILDVLTPFLDVHEEIDGVDYRRAVYIFLCNTGSTAVAEVAFKFWSDGLKREDIELNDIEPLVSKDVFNIPGGLQNSYIIEKNLIDFFVPFLPLEQEHVKSCIIQDLATQKKACSDEFINLILKNTNYYPEEIKLYSKSGCKLVNPKVSNFLNSKRLPVICPKCICWTL